MDSDQAAAVTQAFQNCSKKMDKNRQCCFSKEFSCVLHTQEHFVAHFYCRYDKTSHPQTWSSLVHHHLISVQFHKHQTQTKGYEYKVSRTRFRAHDYWPHQLLHLVVDVQVFLCSFEAKRSCGGRTVHWVPRRRQLPVGCGSKAVPAVLWQSHQWHRWGQDGGRRRRPWRRGGVIAVARRGRKSPSAAELCLRGGGDFGGGGRRGGRRVVAGAALCAVVAIAWHGGGGCRGSVVIVEWCSSIRGRVVVCPAHSVGGRGGGGGRGAAAELVAVLPVQPVQSIECVQDLLLGHAGATQPLQQIYLLYCEARLLTELRHPAAGRETRQRRLWDREVRRGGKRKQEMQREVKGRKVSGLSRSREGNGKRGEEEEEQGGKSGRDDTEGNERIKWKRVKRNAVADEEKNETDGKRERGREKGSGGVK